MAVLSFNNEEDYDVVISGAASGTCNAYTNYNGQGRNPPGLTLDASCPMDIVIKRPGNVDFSASCVACLNSSSSFSPSGDQKSITVTLASLTTDQNITIGENQPC